MLLLICLNCGREIPERRGSPKRCVECRSQPKPPKPRHTQPRRTERLDQVAQLYNDGGITNVIATLGCSTPFAYKYVSRARTLGMVGWWVPPCLRCGGPTRAPSGGKRRKFREYCDTCNPWPQNNRKRNGLTLSGISLLVCRNCNQGFIDFSKLNGGKAKLCPACQPVAKALRQAKATATYRAKLAERRMLERAMKEAWRELHPPPPKPAKPRISHYDPWKAHLQHLATYQRVYTEPPPCIDCGSPVPLPRGGHPSRWCPPCRAERERRHDRERLRRQRLTEFGRERQREKNRRMAERRKQRLAGDLISLP
jgi:hypothetical protein